MNAHEASGSDRRVVTDDEIAQLRTEFRGPLYRPGDPGFDAGFDPTQAEGRQGEIFGKFLWNARFAGQPALIARPSTAADVVALVNFAREGGWSPSVRGGGHNAAGLAEAENDIIIDLSLMRNARLNPLTNTVSMGGGATWWDVDRNTAPFGVACIGGAIGHTGVGGFTLGGGLGRLTRQHGLAVDNLVSADIVTADGAIHYVDAEHEPDLFWAIRGGGGNFGIVTSLEAKVFPVGDVWIDVNWWPVEHIREVLTFWREWSRHQPGNVATSSLVVTAPGNRGFDSELVGKRFVLVTCIVQGDVINGPDITRPMREFMNPSICMAKTMTYGESQVMNDSIANADYGFRNSTKTGLVPELTDEFIDTYSRWAVTQPTAEGISELVALDGPYNDVDPSNTPFGVRTARFNHVITSGWHDPSDDARQIAWVTDYHRDMLRFYDGVYINYLDRGEPQEVIQSAYGPANWQRLREIKTKYDPSNFFHRNHNIPPAQ